MPKHCTKEVKQVITNVRQFFQEERDNNGPTLDVRKVVERTAKAVGVSTRTVDRVSKEFRSEDRVDHFKPKTGRKRIECDEFLQGVIRRKIFNFYMERKFPTVNELYAQITTEVPDLPDFSHRTLYRWLKNMKFSFRKLNNKPVLMEHPRIAAERANFLTSLQRYRNHGWKIYYTDETWCGANHSRQFGWVEKVNPENRDTFDHYRGGVQQVNGYRGGIKRPSGAGQRVIILHIGSEDGFLEGCRKCFIGEKKKAKADYHHEMNKQHFEEWFRHVLSVIPAKSIIIIDQASYHTMLDPDYRNPTAAWKKDDMIVWLLKNNVVLPDGVTHFSKLTKSQLLLLSKPHRYEKVLLLESIAKEVRGDDVKLLWLPVAHCEFNAIELIWAYVKNKIATNNRTFKINDVLILCQEALDNVSTEIWKNSVGHCKKIEKMYVEREHLIDEIMEPLIINLGEDDDDDELSDESSDSSYDEQCDSEVGIEDTQSPHCIIGDDTQGNVNSSVAAGPSGITTSGQFLGNIFDTIQRFTDNTNLGIRPEPIQTTTSFSDFIPK